MDGYNALVIRGVAKRLVRSAPRRFRRFVRQVMPPVLWHTLRDMIEGPGGAPTARPPTRRAKLLESKLWGGFSRRALIELRRLAWDPSSAKRDVADAARVLACWYASQGDFHQAHEHAVLMRLAQPKTAKTELQILLESDSLQQLGEPALAREILARAVFEAPDTTAFQLAMANTYASMGGPTPRDDDHARLEWINRNLSNAGLAPLKKLIEDRPLSLDNITADAASIPAESIPKVSILIPAYKAAQTLHISLESLLRQTWTNLEIVVVDDASPDETQEVAESYARRDPRVIALRQESNRGAYAARNLALHRATGDFVTVHDADDWSHPQKIEVQARALLGHGAAVANLTDWVRCLPHLYFRGRARAALAWVHFNHSSLMLRRDLLLQLGGWDDVRIAADSELIRRLEHGFVEGRVPRIHRGVPLSFALVGATSLTQTNVTHARTLRHGVRRTYHEASIHWLKARPPKDVALPGPERDRAFPASSFILSQHKSHPNVDILVVSDFSQSGPSLNQSLELIDSLEAAGYSVGVFPWHRYDSDIVEPTNQRLLDKWSAGAIALITPGERVAARTTVCLDPLVLKDLLDLPPRMETDRFLVVHDNGLLSALDAERETIDDRIQQLVSQRPTWLLVGPLPTVQAIIDSLDLPPATAQS